MTELLRKSMIFESLTAVLSHVQLGPERSSVSMGQSTEVMVRNIMLGLLITSFIVLTLSEFICIIFFHQSSIC